MRQIGRSKASRSLYRRVPSNEFHVRPLLHVKLRKIRTWFHRRFRRDAGARLAKLASADADDCAAGTSLALLLAIGGFIIRGGGVNGIRFGAGLVLVASSLAFVVAYIAQAPVQARVHGCHTSAWPRARRPHPGFAACMRCFSPPLCSPEVLPASLSPADTGVCDHFDALILAVMVFGTSTRRVLGPSAGRAMLGLCERLFLVRLRGQRSQSHGRPASRGLARTVLRSCRCAARAGLACFALPIPSWSAARCAWQRRPEVHSCA